VSSQEGDGVEADLPAVSKTQARAGKKNEINGAPQFEKKTLFKVR
jgi:hypothetical protein